ncbi:MAG: 6-phosphofructokinase [Anaerolineales bacterium]|nr:6-phosphofructokinase [Anaerolineales bacterium]
MNERNVRGKIGILMGGGPAPGVNGVIHGATIVALDAGYEVFGIYEGFRYLSEGRLEGKPLSITDVSRIHLDGGCILRTSRANPTKSDLLLENCVKTLLAERISHLIAIGGDDTAYSAFRVSRFAREKLGADIHVVHVPKTIDNDLPLPEGIPTFGYETAREVGTELVRNLLVDATTGQRWFLVIAMGRHAGHLALGMGKSAGATVTVIPEEFGAKEIPMQWVTDIFVTTVLKRMAMDRPYGILLGAEGLVEIISRDDLAQLKDVEVDAHGHIRLSEIDSAMLLKREVVKQLEAIGVEGVRIVGKQLGYELRCAPPNAYDVDYTRSLGQAAVEFLVNGGSHATITIQGNQIVPMRFDEMMNPETGRTEVRKVNIDSWSYRSAYRFMIRLKAEDAHNEPLWAEMASLTTLTVDELKARYGYLCGLGTPPF